VLLKVKRRNAMLRNLGRISGQSMEWQSQDGRTIGIIVNFATRSFQVSTSDIADGIPFELVAEMAGVLRTVGEDQTAVVAGATIGPQTSESMSRASSSGMGDLGSILASMTPQEEEQASVETVENTPPAPKADDGFEDPDLLPPPVLPGSAPKRLAGGGGGEPKGDGAKKARRLTH
jgi:hypothetical protein